MTTKKDKLARCQSFKQLKELIYDYYDPKTPEKKRRAVRSLISEYQKEWNVVVETYDPKDDFTKEEMRFWDFVSQSLPKLDHARKKGVIALNVTHVSNFSKELAYYPSEFWTTSEVRGFFKHPFMFNCIDYKTVDSRLFDKSVRCYLFKKASLYSE